MEFSTTRLRTNAEEKVGRWNCPHPFDIKRASRQRMHTCVDASTFYGRAAFIRQLHTSMATLNTDIQQIILSQTHC